MWACVLFTLLLGAIAVQPFEVPPQPINSGGHALAEARCPPHPPTYVRSQCSLPPIRPLPPSRTALRCMLRRALTKTRTKAESGRILITGRPASRMTAPSRNLPTPSKYCESSRRSPHPAHLPTSLVVSLSPSPPPPPSLNHCLPSALRVRPTSLHMIITCICIMHHTRYKPRPWKP